MKNTFFTLFFVLFSVHLIAKELPPDFDGLPKKGEILVNFDSTNSNLGEFHPEELLRMEIVAEIKPGWKIYSIKTQNELAPPPTTIKFDLGNLSVTKELYETDPIEDSIDFLDIDLLVHKNKAHFYVNFEIPKNHPAGNFTLPVDISYTACSFKVCMPPKSLDLTLSYTVTDLPPREAYLIPKYYTANPNIISQNYKSEGLLAFLGLAVVMGLLSLLTPCVFPMIPITISYFSGLYQNNKYKVMRHAGVFSLGIIFFYTSIGIGFSLLFGAESVLALAANPWINIIIGIIFLIFSLSLAGVLTLRLPPKWVSYFDKKSRGAQGYFALVLMGFVFVLTAFTCTVQFVGLLIIAAYQGDVLWPILGMLIFSIIFTLPFFLLALLPGSLNKWRKFGGNWLEKLKIILAILELSIVIKFFSNADQVLGTNIINRDLNIWLWILTISASVLYLLITLFKNKVFDKFSLMASIVFIFLGVTLFQGLRGNSLGALFDSLLPPPESGYLKKSGDFVSNDELAKLIWYDSYEKAKKKAIEEQKTIFIEFTGYTCINCRYVEQNVFPVTKIYKKLSEDYVLAKLYTDGGPYKSYNQDFQINFFGTVSLPHFGIMQGENDIVLKSKSGLLDVDEMNDFLSQN